MHKLIVALGMFGVFLVGCSKTHTVDEFLADKNLRGETLRHCMESPGERMLLPNCVNSKAADAKNRQNNFGKALEKGQ